MLAAVVGWARVSLSHPLRILRACGWALPLGSPAVETLQLERSEGVATITLNRPKVKNAMNAELWEELSLVCWTRSPRTRRIAVVVITGAGGDFCSGADLGGGGPFSGETPAS